MNTSETEQALDLRDKEIQATYLELTVMLVNKHSVIKQHNTIGVGEKVFKPGEKIPGLNENVILNKDSFYLKFMEKHLLALGSVEHIRANGVSDILDVLSHQETSFVNVCLEVISGILKEFGEAANKCGVQTEKRATYLLAVVFKETLRVIQS